MRLSFPMNLNTAFSGGKALSLSNQINSLSLSWLLLIWLWFVRFPFVKRIRRLPSLWWATFSWTKTPNVCLQHSAFECNPTNLLWALFSQVRHFIRFLIRNLQRNHQCTLFYVECREYLYERIKTSFSASSVIENWNDGFYMGLCEAFFAESHHVREGRMTISSFGKRASEFVLNNPYLTLLHFELNTRLLLFVMKFVSGDKLLTPFTLTDLKEMFLKLIRDISDIQIGKETFISKQYDLWPLKHPTLLDALEDMRSSHLNLRIKDQ